MILYFLFYLDFHASNVLSIIISKFIKMQINFFNMVWPKKLNNENVTDYNLGVLKIMGGILKLFCNCCVKSKNFIYNDYTINKGYQLSRFFSGKMLSAFTKMNLLKSKLKTKKIKHNLDNILVKYKRKNKMYYDLKLLHEMALLNPDYKCSEIYQATMKRTKKSLQLSLLKAGQHEKGKKKDVRKLQ